MTKRLATCLAAAALLAAFHVTHAAETRRAAPFPAQAAPDIKGLKLGMTQKDVTAIFPHAKCSPAGCIVRPVSFGGTPNAALAAYLANGKTVRIDAILLSPETFDQLTTLVDARLGPSTDDPRLPADDEHKTWLGDHWFLDAKRFDDEMFSSMSLVDPAHVGDESHYEAAEAAKKL